MTNPTDRIAAIRARHDHWFRDAAQNGQPISTTHAWVACTAEQAARIATLEARIERLQSEVDGWRECALYDATMEGPRFKGWDRSALDRMRLRAAADEPTL